MSQSTERHNTIKALTEEIKLLESRLNVLRSALQVMQEIVNEANAELPLVKKNELVAVQPTKTERSIFERLLPLFEQPKAYTVSQMLDYFSQLPNVDGRAYEKTDTVFRYYIQKLYKAKFLYRYAAEGQPNDRKYWYSLPKYFLDNGYPNIELRAHINDAIHGYFVKSLLDGEGKKP